MLRAAIRHRWRPSLGHSARKKVIDMPGFPLRRPGERCAWPSSGHLSAKVGAAGSILSLRKRPSVNHPFVFPIDITRCVEAKVGIDGMDALVAMAYPPPILWL